MDNNPTSQTRGKERLDRDVMLWWHWDFSGCSIRGPDNTNYTHHLAHIHCERTTRTLIEQMVYSIQHHWTSSCEKMACTDNSRDPAVPPFRLMKLRSGKGIVPARRAAVQTHLWASQSYAFRGGRLAVNSTVGSATVCVRSWYTVAMTLTIALFSSNGSSYLGHGLRPS
jgi:hypothetical protein